MKFYDKLIQLDENAEIGGNTYYQRLHKVIDQLRVEIDNNKKEIDQTLSVLSKYVKYKEDDEATDISRALVALVFKDLKTVSSLKEFSYVLNRWNRTLLLYHTIVKSESPDQISLTEIQNGSIDVIINLDFDVAIDFVELVKTGFKVYGAYLLYKTELAKKIIESFQGNKKLVTMEAERERIMLENVQESIKNHILNQHKEKVKTDGKIDKTGVNKKAEEVSKVITDHMVKGNEVKLLTPPRDEDSEDLSEELREETASVRSKYKLLSAEDKRLLLDKHVLKDDDKQSPPPS